MNAFDLNLVRSFVAIYETQSVTAAAQRLSLSQPTVSYALGRMREALADPLFVREQRVLRPTPRAHGLYPRFVDALASVDAALEEPHRFDPSTTSRSFSLAMSDIGSMSFLPPLEVHLRPLAPGLRLEIQQVPVDEIINGLAAGKIDAALGHLPTLRGRGRSSLLFRERYVCLVGRRHAQRIGAMSVDHFLASRHVAVSSTFSGHRLAEDVLAELGVVRQIAIDLPYFTALPQLIAQGELVVILPSRVAATFCAQGEVVMLEAPFKLPEFEVRLYWHPRHEANPALQWLLAQIQTALSGL